MKTLIVNHYIIGGDELKKALNIDGEINDIVWNNNKGKLCIKVLIKDGENI